MGEMDKRVEMLEGEFKLIKGQLRQTMIDVRDFLHNLKVPADWEARRRTGSQPEVPQPGFVGSPQASSVIEVPVGEIALAEAGGGGEVYHAPPAETAWEDSSMAPPQDMPLEEAVPPPMGELAEESIPEPSEEVLEEEPVPPLPREPEDRLPLHEDLEPVEPQPEFEQLEQEQNREVTTMREGEMAQTTSQVNLLANLIRWVATAKREVGLEQMPVFLDTYALSGHLPTELKEGVLRLAEVIDQRSEDGDGADVWSKLILELHGILTGSGTPLRLFDQFLGDWGDEQSQADEGEPEVDREENLPVRLKLVLPDSGSGGEREFSITLTPDTEDEMP